MTLHFRQLGNILKVSQTEGLQSATRRVYSAQTEKCKKNSKPRKSRSFALNMFRGQIESSDVFPYPQSLTVEQKGSLNKFLVPVRRLLRGVSDARKNEGMDIVSETTLKDLFQMGVFSMQVPQKFGGMGMSSTECLRVLETVATHDLGLSAILASHQCVGYQGILMFGSPELKAKYLPVLTSQMMLTAFCLSEETAGSDVTAMKSRAELSSDGKHYVLNGSKVWVTNGTVTSLMTVFAYTPVKDEESGQVKDKVTAFIVDRSLKGITTGPLEETMGLKHSNLADLHFKDVKVPVENVLGGVGNGFVVAMSILNYGRVVHNCVLSGAMRNAIDRAVEFANNHLQFGRSIASYAAIQEKIARMSARQYVAESAAYLLGGMMDSGCKELFVEATMSKVLSSENVCRVLDDAMEVLGGLGYLKRAGLERLYRDARAFRIVEGCNDSLRPVIALTGLKYAETHLEKPVEVFNNGSAIVGALATIATQRGIAYGKLGAGPDLTRFVHPNLQEPMEMASRAIAEFSWTVETALICKKQQDQFLINRLANSAIDLYSMIVTLSRCTRSLNDGLLSAQHETLMTKMWCTEASIRIKRHLRAVPSKRDQEHLVAMKEISKNVCRNGSVLQECPLGI